MKMPALAMMFTMAATPGAVAQGVTVSGMVAHPGAMDAAALSRLKQITYQGSFESMTGKQMHAWTGPLLLDVLNQAGITDAPGRTTLLQHVILARGSDHYAVAVAIGEIEPKAEGKQVMVALAQDGKKMDAPRLVVPRDASLTRCVHDLAEIEVR